MIRICAKPIYGWVRKNRWFLVFAIGFLGIVGWIVHLNVDTNASILDGFSGNLIGGLVANILVLFLALQLSASTNETIEKVGELSIATESILREQKERREVEERHARFISILESQSYYDIFLMDPRYKMLTYTIDPVRDESGKLRVYKTEMKTLYVVKVRPLGHIRVNSERYQASPIRENEYYFCDFYNGQWHMSLNNFAGPWYQFGPSGKVGQVEHGQSANGYMGLYQPPTDMTEIAVAMLTDALKPPNAGEGCDRYALYRDGSGRIFLKINADSPLKKVYRVNSKRSFTEESYTLTIDDLRGYGSPEKQEKIVSFVASELERLQVTAPVVPWYELEDKG